MQVDDHLQSTGLDNHQRRAAKLQELKAEVESVESRIRDKTRNIVKAEENLACAISRAETLRSTSSSRSACVEDIVAYSMLISKTTCAPPAWRVHYGLDALVLPPNPIAREERVRGHGGEDYLIPSMVNVSWLRERTEAEQNGPLPLAESSSFQKLRTNDQVQHKSKYSKKRTRETEQPVIVEPKSPAKKSLKVAGFSDSDDDSE
jgi:hypothetical protein